MDAFGDDPAAEFLAREREDLAGLENELQINNNITEGKQFQILST